MTQRSRTTPDRLTLMPEELAVAHLVADGHSNRDVAHRLVVSQKTVKYRLRNVYVKSRFAESQACGKPPNGLKCSYRGSLRDSGNLKARSRGGRSRPAARHPALSS